MDPAVSDPLIKQNLKKKNLVTFQSRATSVYVCTCRLLMIVINATGENFKFACLLFALYFLKKLFIFLSGDRGMLVLRRTSDYGKTIKTVAAKIYSFGLGGRFLFASVMTGKVSVHLVQIVAI